MIYIYNDFGGTHTTALAAAYHLNKLDGTHEPTTNEIMNTHNFNKLVYKDRGKFYFHGKDEDGNKVYTMGRGRSKILVPGVFNLIDMLMEEEVLNEKIILSNTSPTVPFAMTCGGMLSRWLKIDFIGVPLLVIGAKQAYKDIFNLVQHTKQTAKSSTSQLIMLDNKDFK
ncbi:DUF3189 family protein [Paenibacillus alginolyticus]|uniref:DUF3189 family protein n=1 Tax=Paenibacillus alginolyticus TaxID=59839 RepID=A0ABT4G6B5_9BACL|nr:DUF3189 family protein [Paenibacillus alginolyticus]MCY9667762.1 DUF3189 family protein [Paenibacillus alginolyticus]MCY9691717.1 DUF3189 family protein [Paenibacillus alginolyticus]MEC0144067.1 DUF3189 family protein [Paenibacillus alginolyticus]